MNEQIVSRVRAAIYGMYIGDSLSMPVHWYYDRSKIYQDFGRDGITKYEKPMPTFAGSIMNLSNTGGGGRGSDKGSIIGDVLVKGKKKYWERGANFHYHHGMQAGDNTLDTLVARLMMNFISSQYKNLGNRSFSNKFYSSLSHSKQSAAVNEFTTGFLSAYVNFMIEKDSHNDTYVATAHRMFFSNWVKDKYVIDCADNDGHNTDSIDGIINVGAITLAEIVTNSVKTYENLNSENKAINFAIFDSINVIRKSQLLPKYGEIYHNLLIKIIVEGTDLRAAILEIIDENKKVFDKLGLDKRLLETYSRTGTKSDPMSACYIESNFPIMIMMAYKYHDSVGKALLACANAGGENVNRGALLGTIMGAAHGMNDEIMEWSAGLRNREQYAEEIEKFLQPIMIDKSL